MNNLPALPSNLINLFGFYIKMETNVSKLKWENNIFFHSLWRTNFTKTVIIYKQIELQGLTRKVPPKKTSYFGF